MLSCVALLCGPPLLGFQKHVWVVDRDMKTELEGVCVCGADVRGVAWGPCGVASSDMCGLRACVWERRAVQTLCVQQGSSVGTAHVPTVPAHRASWADGYPSSGPKCGSDLRNH